MRTRDEVNSWDRERRPPQTCQVGASCGFSSENVTQQPLPTQCPKVTPIHAKKAREHAGLTVVNEATQILSKLKAAGRGCPGEQRSPPRKCQSFVFSLSDDSHLYLHFDRAKLKSENNTNAGVPCWEPLNLRR